ncbi:MAG: hypothetical protein HOP07_01575 [Bacteriovoracaceae bacterium]|nr:hypothetical protein [Bacteriovoracaceae bacterium]
MKKLNRFFYGLIILTSFASAEEKKELDFSFRMNTRYESGAILIYDCVGAYYTCVNDDGLSSCRERRTISQLSEKNPLNCAPLKIFKTRLECLKENYRVVELAGPKPFCYPKRE